MKTPEKLYFSNIVSTCKVISTLVVKSSKRKFERKSKVTNHFFTILRRIERWIREQNLTFFWVYLLTENTKAINIMICAWDEYKLLIIAQTCLQFVEKCMVPHMTHIIPVLYNTIMDWISYIKLMTQICTAFSNNNVL